MNLVDLSLLRLFYSEFVVFFKISIKCASSQINEMHEQYREHNELAVFFILGTDVEGKPLINLWHCFILVSPENTYLPRTCSAPDSAFLFNRGIADGVKTLPGERKFT